MIRNIDFKLKLLFVFFIASCSQNHYSDISKSSIIIKKGGWDYYNSFEIKKDVIIMIKHVGNLKAKKEEIFSCNMIDSIVDSTCILNILNRIKKIEKNEIKLKEFYCEVIGSGYNYAEYFNVTTNDYKFNIRKFNINDLHSLEDNNKVIVKEYMQLYAYLVDLFKKNNSSSP